MSLVPLIGERFLHPRTGERVKVTKVFRSYGVHYVSFRPICDERKFRVAWVPLNRFSDLYVKWRAPQ